MMPSSVVLSTEKNLRHRRRINTEEKAKVVPAAGGMELIQFLSALANLHQDDLKKRMNKITAIAGMDALKKWKIILFTPHQTNT